MGFIASSEKNADGILCLWKTFLCIDPYIEYINRTCWWWGDIILYNNQHDIYVFNTIYSISNEDIERFDIWCISDISVWVVESSFYIHIHKTLYIKRVETKFILCVIFIMLSPLNVTARLRIQPNNCRMWEVNVLLLRGKHVGRPTVTWFLCKSLELEAIKWMTFNGVSTLPLGPDCTE